MVDAAFFVQLYAAQNSPGVLMNDRHWDISRLAAQSVFGLALCGTAATAANPLIKTQTCSLKPSGISECPQIDPAKGKLTSIKVNYSSSSKFALVVVGEKFTTTNYKVVVWQELDTQGGDFGSFYITSTGTIDVLPQMPSQPSGYPEILITGSFKNTETDPKKLSRFIGTSVVPIIPIVEPATGQDKKSTVGTGKIHTFTRLSSNVSGSLELTYQVIIKKPNIKLPPQDLPEPFKVPPYPKPK